MVFRSICSLKITKSIPNHENGQVVGHALIVNETKDILSNVVEIFKEENNNCQGLETVVVDKDFAEISAIQDMNSNK